MMKFGTVLAKAAPIAKKVAPIVFAATVSAIQAIGEQKTTAHIDNLENRIKDLEQLFKK